MLWPSHRCLKLSLAHPPVTAAELAVQLELELLTYGRTGFIKRLRRALAEAYRQGQQNKRRPYLLTRKLASESPIALKACCKS